MRNGGSDDEKTIFSDLKNMPMGNDGEKKQYNTISKGLQNSKSRRASQFEDRGISSTKKMDFDKENSIAKLTLLNVKPNLSPFND